ncbi:MULTISPECIES: electron transfer flavoprotein subunit beta/FixA family protein [Limnochorda]|uniref:electron transfer flavoprotein subunit beta/FixA family protein n=1 Tax=Limnochorda TaxID=1676651 RepID=UPI0017A3186B|nr:electron transfer flavoprotein subunit beta/FixA family protein [Limnochorda pilosa]MBO2485549.1 electron transfer flavoprotein subunit beta/FixA family protein [Bacillota bacterium]MBO2518653.1 electron transfer flavoprotein subunit beta/FixA family protein [Bacillota bacterium]NMA72433.1 electron transfer flavoprotein subunit beta/FixA family protein [Bacillota bacterium]
MHVVVCIKQILDPEIPPREFQVDPQTKRAVRGRASLVISPFDLNALEVAVQLKERAGGRVTVVSLGGEETPEALRRALAMGADEAVWIRDGALEATDASGTARCLAAAIAKLDEPDLVLFGRQAGDWDQGLVGPMVAEALGWPLVTNVFQTRGENSPLELLQQAEGGYRVVAATLPAAATITNHEANVARLPKVREIMLANRKPITQWSLGDLGLAADEVAPRVVVEALAVPVPEGHCTFIEGETAQEKAQNLARALRELKVI